MKLIDVYKKYKEKYPKYVILIRSGNFYEVYGEECYILNNIFGYSIRCFNGHKRVGFPIIAFNKVTDKLNYFKINYFVIDNDLNKKKFNKNRYDEYICNLDIDYRISSINEKLNLLRDSYKIKSILERIERFLWKIILNLLLVLRD